MKSDVELKRDVLEELDWDPSIDASQIGVTTHEGVVTMTGHVITHTEKHTAEKLAKRVHGVKALANDIEVRPGDSHQRDDEHIAQAAALALEWDASVPKEQFQVIVRDGWISLEGTAAHVFEKDAAERAVRHLIGVRGVLNQIVVKPMASPAASETVPKNVMSDIESALRRSALVNSKQITMEVEEDGLVLTGDVHSRAEHDEVERIAKRAGCATRVENCITVTPWGYGPMEEWGY